MKKLALLDSTGQRWKFVVATLTPVLGLPIMWFGGRWFGYNAQLWGSLFTFSGLVFACVSIKCPDCRSRWMWDAVSDRDHSDWDGWLFSLEKCPYCGYSEPVDDPARPNRVCPRCDQTTYNLVFCDVCGKDFRENLPEVAMPTNHHEVQNGLTNKG